VVLSDIEMADEDGFALIRKLRALPQDRGGKTPAAGLTGCSSAGDRARVLQAGFQCYLAKPVDAKMLVHAVAVLASRTVAATSAAR
jgi:CheY-like chemotaxis protein